jgi:hypothetical protein
VTVGRDPGLAQLVNGTISVAGSVTFRYDFDIAERRRVHPLIIDSGTLEFTASFPGPTGPGRISRDSAVASC